MKPTTYMNRKLPNGMIKQRENSFQCYKLHKEHKSSKTRNLFPP